MGPWSAHIPAPGVAVYSLYVGNLPFTATNETIQNHFVGCNLVDCRLLYEQDGEKQFKGAAFADVAGEDGLSGALKYHKSNLGGRRILVLMDKMQKIKGQIANCKSPGDVLTAIESHPVAGKLETNTVVLAVISLVQLMLVPLVGWHKRQGWERLLKLIEESLSSCSASQFLKLCWSLAKLPLLPDLPISLKRAIEAGACRCIRSLEDFNFKDVAKLEYTFRKLHLETDEVLGMLGKRSAVIIADVNSASSKLTSRIARFVEQAIERDSVYSVPGKSHVLLVESDSLTDLFKTSGFELAYWRRFCCGAKAGRSWPQQTRKVKNEI
jgi:hypothetical protein